MAFTFDGAQANVTLTTSGELGLPKPTTDQTVISGTASINSNTNTVLYSVPAGKTFYFTGHIITTSGGTGVIKADFKNDGTSFHQQYNGGYTGNTNTVGANVSRESPEPILENTDLSVTSTVTNATNLIAWRGFLIDN